jgi:hypothetical protein
VQEAFLQCGAAQQRSGQSARRRARGS